MGIRDIILVIFYLKIVHSAVTPHEPKVYEELDEQPPVYIRTTRHLDGAQKIFQPPLFNYRKAAQQDRLVSKYHRQQQADFRNIKIAPANPDIIFRLHQRLGENRGKPMSIPFDDNSNDWKPFQPKFLNPIKSTKSAPVNQKKKLIENVRQKDTIKKNAYENDLSIAGSEVQEHEIKPDRENQRSQYIYIKPSILKNNFGLDSETTEQILQNSAPENVDAVNSDKFQVSELQELLGKNPSFQLQGLQRLLEDSKPIIENNLQISNPSGGPGIQIEHNGSPSLEALQQQIDAVNKAQEEQVLAAAQKEAEAHVQAQHQAIALAQKKSQEEALAKIAAHNQGISTIKPDNLEGVNHITAAPLVAQGNQEVDFAEPEVRQHEAIQDIDQNSLNLQHQEDTYVARPEISALHTRPLDQLLVHPVREYSESYAPSTQDLRNNKPIIQGSRARFYSPVSLTRPDTENSKLQYLSAVPPLYNPKEVQNYSPVSPYTPHLVSSNGVDIPKVIPTATTSTLIDLPTLQEQIEPSANGKQLYESQENHYDDGHQYAAKYAFGYQILDEEHGNDFGHEEERNGKLTKGHYFVRLPDGRKQRVEYYADNSGYHARVSYENVGVHPYVSRQQAERTDQLQPIHK